MIWRTLNDDGYDILGDFEDEDIYCRPQDMTGSYPDHAEAYHDIRYRYTSGPSKIILRLHCFTKY
jgi:hypothetical protein